MYATLIDPRGKVGTHVQPDLWHPCLSHYGRNWRVPGDGTYTLRVRFAAPTYHRHDRTNGRRFAEGAEVMFRGVEITSGKEAGKPADSAAPYISNLILRA